VTAALLEAAIAALYLEHGYEPIAPAIVAAFSDRIEFARTTHVDHKTELQEALAKTGRAVAYVVTDVEGPAHERFFSCAAEIDGEVLGTGSGRTKKEAEQAAAQEALVAIGAGR
jgi:ribonuclease III